MLSGVLGGGCDSDDDDDDDDSDCSCDGLTVLMQDRAENMRKAICGSVAVIIIIIIIIIVMAQS